MRIDVEQLKEELNLTPFGALGWLTDKNSNCPFCEGKGKWGLMINPNGGVFHCWKCGGKTSLYNYLKQIDRLDLSKVAYEKSIKKTSLSRITKDEEKTEEEEIKEVVLPKRTKLLSKDKYLDDRGFKKYHYDEFEPCYTDFFLEKKLHNYIIFKMKNNGKLVGWLARSRRSKEWHKQNLKDSKEKGARLVLRYENSAGTDFSKIVGGLDEIIEGKTKTVITVEGLFDKINIDNLLRLYECDEIKCLFTFGNSISKEQVSLIESKGVEQVILMYDDNTINQSKSAGFVISDKIETKIAHLTRTGIDPGDMDIEYLEEVLSKLEDPINFYVNKIDRKF